MNRRQTIPAHLRYTRQQFDREFPSDDVCLETLKEQRWPGGVARCEKCNADHKHYRVKGRTAYACDHCGNHIYPLAGTIFQKSTTPLRVWFQAMYLMGSTRCGISAKQIQRETGVTYKTAWRMFKQIRMLLSEDLQVEGSTVEMDEVYIGGRPRGKRGGPKWLEPSKKAVVAGVVARKGKVIARVVPDATKKTLQDFAYEFILPKSTVFTDEHKSYADLDKTYAHHRINHSQGVYVRGNVHTQTIEGFWSLVQNGIRGVYHSVSKKYLQSYLNEYAFRYNHRDCGNLIFPLLVQRASQPALLLPSEPTSQTQRV
ncbi:MAG TPA: IS1595 family transposase [Terriglobales bacterium]|jgi:transposase|nr:IS1595 family transposase [Terriglobales bacterium]